MCQSLFLVLIFYFSMLVYVMFSSQPFIIDDVLTTFCLLVVSNNLTSHATYILATLFSRLPNMFLKVGNMFKLWCCCSYRKKLQRFIQTVLSIDYRRTQYVFVNDKVFYSYCPDTLNQELSRRNQKSIHQDKLIFVSFMQKYQFCQHKTIPKQP